MTNTVRIFWAVGAVIVLVLLGWLAGRVGGVAIRTQEGGWPIQLTLSQPVIPCTPINVQVNGKVTSLSILSFSWRDLTGELPLGVALVSDNQVRLVLPGSGARSGSLVVRDKNSQQVLGSEPVRLLAPGQDCVISRK